MRHTIKDRELLKLLNLNHITLDLEIGIAQRLEFVWFCQQRAEVVECRIPFEVWAAPKEGNPSSDNWHGNCHSGRGKDAESALRVALREAKRFADAFWSK